MTANLGSYPFPAQAAMTYLPQNESPTKPDLHISKRIPIAISQPRSHVSGRATTRTKEQGFAKRERVSMVVVIKADKRQQSPAPPPAKKKKGLYQPRDFPARFFRAPDHQETGKGGF